MSRITVTTVTRSLTVISGFGARELVTEIRNGRHPLWSRRPRGWVVQPQTAADVAALAEERGYTVVYEDGGECG